MTFYLCPPIYTSARFVRFGHGGLLTVQDHGRHDHAAKGQLGATGRNRLS